MLARFVLTPMNRLLDEQAVLRTQLAAHGGKTALIEVAGLSLRFRISATGSLEATDGGHDVDVCITLPAAALPGLLDGPGALATQARVSGDAGLAEAISKVLGNLRPDVGALLSPWLGDILANRAERGLQGVAAASKRSAQGLATNLSEYLREESGLLLGEAEMREHAADLVKLRDQLARLDKRIAAIR